MFHEMRADVLPVDDIGLQKAVALHYFDGERPTRGECARSADAVAALSQRRHVVSVALARSDPGGVLSVPKFRSRRRNPCRWRAVARRIRRRR